MGKHPTVDARIADAALTRLEVDHRGLDGFDKRYLTLIAENPGGSLVRLARALSVTPPNISTMVDRLETKGLVARSASEEDRRAQVLRVTAKGADLVRKATQRIVQAEGEALPLTAGEQAILAELLHKVAAARAKGAGRA